MTKHLTCQNIIKKLKQCLRDERGIAMTEYILATAITLPLAFYLLHPDNGLYQIARAQYELTKTLLIFPGP